MRPNQRNNLVVGRLRRVSKPMEILTLGERLAETGIAISIFVLLRIPSNLGAAAVVGADDPGVRRQLLVRVFSKLLQPLTNRRIDSFRRLLRGAGLKHATKERVFSRGLQCPYP